MRVTVNGEARDLRSGTTLGELLEGLGAAHTAVVAERNGKIVERSRAPGVVLEEGDRLELVRFVGGG